MPINFPNAPVLDEEFVHEYAYKYRWDGVKWVAVGRTPVTGGGGGVIAFATVTSLIEASQVSLTPGYYEVVGIALAYWDGTVFRDSDGGNEIELSPVMDHLDDVAFWFRPGNKTGTRFSEIVSGDQLTSWRSNTENNLVAERSPSASLLLSDIRGREAVRFRNVTFTAPSSVAADIIGPFEIFALVKIRTDTQMNAVVSGIWNGSAGWLLVAAESASPHGVAFGFDGVYARASSRMSIAPQVLHARYTGTDLIVSLNGVDVGTTPKTGTTSSVASLSIGSYNSLSSMNGWVSDLIKIDKLLTTPERTAIVDDLLSKLETLDPGPMPAFVVNDWQSSYVTTVADGDPVDVIPEPVNGMTLSSTGTARGIYRANAAGIGYPAIQLDGSNDEYVRAGLSTLAGGHFTLFVLIRFITLSADVRIWGHDNLAGTGVGLFGHQGSHFQTYAGSYLSLVDTQDASAEASLLTLSTDADGVTFWGTLTPKRRVLRANTGFPTGTSTFGIGRKYLGFGVPPNGFFYGMWAVPATITDEEEAEMRTWIRRTYPDLF
jgi:hypothetical protein